MQTTRLTADEVAARYRCSPDTVIRWTRSGIRGVRLKAEFAGKWLIAEDDLLAFVAQTTAVALGDGGAPSPALPDPPAKRRKRAADAMIRMKSEGLI